MTQLDKNKFEKNKNFTEKGASLPCIVCVYSRHSATFSLVQNTVVYLTPFLGVLGIFSGKIMRTCVYLLSIPN